METVDEGYKNIFKVTSIILITMYYVNTVLISTKWFYDSPDFGKCLDVNPEQTTMTV